MEPFQCREREGTFVLLTSTGQPAPWRNKVLKDTAMLNGSALLGQIASVVQSIVVMRLIAPGMYGIWLGLTIILTYGALAHLGSEHGLGIRLPYLRGRRQKLRAEAMANSVFIGWTSLTLLIALGIALYAELTKNLPVPVRHGLFAIALLLPLNQQSSFYSRWQGAALTDFKLSAILSVIRSWTSLLIVVPLVFFLRLDGLMIGSVLVAAIVYIGWKKASPYHFRRAWSPTLFWQALRIGLPMTLVVLGGGLIQSVDRIVIVSLLGATSLGYYGVTTLGGAVVYGLLAQAGSAMGPHITVEMGRNDDRAASLARFLVAPTIAFAYVSAFAISALIVVIPALVILLLPQYVPGLRAFLVYVPGYFFMSIILTANTILTLVLIARRKQRIALFIQGAAIAIEAGLGFLMVRIGLGLPGVAAASTIAYAFYGVSILWLAATQVLGGRAHAAGFVLRVMTPAAIMFPGMILTHVAVGRFIPNLFGAIGLQLLVLALLAGLLLRLLNQQVSVRALALDFWSSVRVRLPRIS